MFVLLLSCFVRVRVRYDAAQGFFSEFFFNWTAPGLSEVAPTSKSWGNRVFPIYHVLLGWKTCKYYYETVELPNPRPTPTQDKLGYKWHLDHFFPQQIFFRGLGLIFYRKQTINTRNRTEPKSSANTLFCLLYTSPSPRD